MIALYIRLSEADEDIGEEKYQSNSVENQRKLLYDYLAEHPEMRDEGAEEFVDDGYSGMTFDRPAFQRMLMLIRQQKVQTVMVKDFSRFGRDYVETAEYLEKLFPFMGVRFLSIADSYDSWNGQEDRQMEIAMKNIVNSYYSRDLSKKIRSTIQMKRRNGEYVSAARPFGYLPDPENKATNIIDPEPAKIVRRIFSLACEGFQPMTIAKMLNREGLPTIEAYNREHKVYSKEANHREVSGHAAWNAAKVKYILENETYAGTYIGQKRTLAIPGSRRRVAVEDVVRIPDHHPAIVSMEQFEKAQECIRHRCFMGKDGRRFPLKGMVRCGCCGYAMHYAENLYEGYFYCSHTAETGVDAGCIREPMNENILNSVVFSQLKAWFSLLQTACGNADAAEQKRWDGLRRLNEQAEEAQAELKDCGKRKLELYEAYSEGNVSGEKFLEQKAALVAEQDGIRERLDGIHIQEGKLRNIRNRRKPELDDLMRRVNLFENEEKLTQTMAENFVQEVKVYDKWHIEITWQWQDIVYGAIEEMAEMQTDTEE